MAKVAFHRAVLAGVTVPPGGALARSVIAHTATAEAPPMTSSATTWAPIATGST